VTRPDVERIVRRWTQEAIAEGRLEVFDELLAANFQRRKGGRVVEHWTMVGVCGATQALRT
jgi:hypothetical protein